jgi:hypothetical protein
MGETLGYKKMGRTPTGFNIKYHKLTINKNVQPFQGSVMQSAIDHG